MSELEQLNVILEKNLKGDACFGIYLRNAIKLLMRRTSYNEKLLKGLYFAVVYLTENK